MAIPLKNGVTVIGQP